MTFNLERQGIFAVYIAFVKRSCPKDIAIHDFHDGTR